jgi:hypothetical protein
VIVDQSGAFAICGHGGAGKSALAAALCRAGARFVCDDLAAFGTDPARGPLVWPDGQCLQLFGDAIAALGLESLRRGEIRPGIGKFHVEPPGEVAAESVSLKAVYLLEAPLPRKKFQVEELAPLEAAQELLARSYRRALTMAFAGDGRHVRMAAAVLSHARVFRVNTPLGLQFVAETAALILAHSRATS